MKKVTPTHMAIQAIDDTIKELKLRRAQLAATLPEHEVYNGPMIVTNPLTGKALPQRRKGTKRRVS